ncbi:Copper chaperone CopZ [Saccharopolyspora antimicrobica]|uniref:Copper chaperone CopZ n=2 Tax=Saccharopolyspora TaxID=1835 RepID=A0A1I4TRZ1_9PSEU|nr:MULTISPECIES: heavy metal-associated domain-containing protein [Saccharopolyspora]RKT88523.1 copper chaperone CopZ [Saccharopolyspora antimicrobica]SEG16393.1 Copper chaperone CopZ [Saccharopolyspora kobensis]SFF10465.1 Copper chaperone CopZ [Saccharopolyspora kobensis]SFM79335.1 Copper chaperone CopZ [Saccharopolyspora antimicrobica]
MAQATFVVKGMTCSGCMTKVTNAVTGVAGVSDVDVDISSGELTVTGESAVDTEAVRRAVGDAGYEIAG